MGGAVGAVEWVCGHHARKHGIEKQICHVLGKDALPIVTSGLVRSNAGLVRPSCRVPPVVRRLERLACRVAPVLVIVVKEVAGVGEASESRCWIDF
jgi:hypothetical protein